MSKSLFFASKLKELHNVRRVELDIENKLKLNVLLVIVHISVLTSIVDLIFKTMFSENNITIGYALVFLAINIIIAVRVMSGKNVELNGLLLIFSELVPIILFWSYSSLSDFEVSMPFIYVVVITIMIVDNKIQRRIFTLYTCIFIFMIYFDLSNPLRHGSTTIEYINVVFGTLIVGSMIFLIIGQYRRQLKLIRNKLYDYTIKDPLTDVYNVRLLNDELDKNKKLWNENKVNYSLAIIDLDNFKAINDTYGHKTGDEILLKFSKLIKSGIRTNDMIFRYGGDEFIILFPKTSANKANDILNKISLKLSTSLEVSFSIGISSISELAHDTQTGDIIKHADNKLYKAKKYGKNQIVY